jgi:divalent metal cation (Fe/Co/Zn/Cd) transporter
MKKRVCRRLSDNLILAEAAAETKICVLLSVSALLGVGLFALTGAAWLDPVAGFVIAAFAIYEGRGHGRANSWRTTTDGDDGMMRWARWTPQERGRRCDRQSGF